MEGYKQKKYPVATKRYVQWLELESDEEAIREYRRFRLGQINGRTCHTPKTSRMGRSGRQISKMRQRCYQR